MAITAARHVKSVTRGGAASVVVTCQRMGESPGICRRRWSRFVAVMVACQGVVELCGIRHRKWSRAAMVTAACQGMMELRGIHHRKWSEIAVAAVSHLGVQIHQLKFDSSRS